MIPTLTLPRIAGLTSLLVILGFIWFAAPLFEMKGVAPFAAISTRLVLCLIVILALLLVITVEWFIVKQRQTQEEQAQQAELQKQKAAFKQAARQTTAQLYKIFPLWQWRKLRALIYSAWYVVLGDTSWDATGLAHTLDFDVADASTLSQHTLKSTTRPQAFTWHFSKKEVFVVMAAQRAEDQAKPDWALASSEPTWHAIARFIKRFRRLRPINGIILTLSLPKLLLSEKALQAQQQMLTTTLQSLRQQFNRRLPVYLILTDCHQLAGFQEFFADLSKADQEKPWGIMLPKQAFADVTSLQHYVHHEFAQLIQQLQDRLLAYLETEKNQQNRIKVSYFPQQLELAKSALTELLPAPHYAQLRGIYFSGNAKDNQLYDFILQAACYKFGLLTQKPSFHAVYEKAYFVKGLLRAAVLPEADGLRYGHRFNFLSYRASYTFGILAILLTFFGLSASYTRNRVNIGMLSDNATEFQQIESETNLKAKNIADILPLLDAAKKIKDVYPAASKQWLLNFELYEPFKIQASSDEVLQRTLATQLLPRVALQLERILQQTKSSQADTELIYLALKGYLAFAHSTKTKPTWIIAPLVKDNELHSALKPEAQATLEDYLGFAAQAPLPQFPLSHKLIEQTRNYLQNYPLAEFAYYELKQAAEELLPQLELAEHVGDSFNQVFNYPGAKHTVPSLYTYQGYHQLYGKKGIALIQQAADMYWVLGLKPGAAVNLLAQEMTPQLWARYSRDYTYYWERLLAGLQIAKANSIPQMIALLDNLTASESPLQGLLNLVVTHTSHIKGTQLSISPRFAKLNSITQANPKQPGLTYQTIRKQLTAVKAYMTTLNNAPDVAQASFEAARAYMQGVDNPIKQLKQLAQRSPEPLNRWLDEIANTNLGLLLAGAHQVANAAWQSQVLPAYQADIHGRYPFERNAEARVSLTGFGEFFGAGGTLDKLSQTYLLPFIDTSRHPWRLREFGGYSLNLSAKTVSNLEKAASIQKLYFSNGGKIPALQFAIQPRFLDSQAQSVTLQYGNQSLSYRHGPQQVSNWNWPLASEMQQASLAINDFNGQSYSRSFNGPWAWLQLFSNTKLEAGNGPGHYIWTIKEANHQASFELWTANNLPIFTPSLFTDLHFTNEL